MAVANIKVSPVNMATRKALDMRSGDHVRVWIKIEEKGKTRLQAFEGTVLARKGGTTAGAMFTVRRVAGGYGVEKIFPLYSPSIDKIEILRRVKTRRAKLYHIRDKAAKEIRRQMRKMQTVNITAGNEPVEVEEAPAFAEASAGNPVEETPMNEPEVVVEEIK